MPFRRIELLIDCDSDQEKNTVQSLCNDISNMRVIKGKDVVAMYPKIKQHREDLIKLFSLIVKGGPKAILSLEGARIISKFTKSM